VRRPDGHPIVIVTDAQQVEAQQLDAQQVDAQQVEE
jgi:hypothetical protein